MQTRSGFWDLNEEFPGDILSMRGQSSEISCREHRHVRHATEEIQNNVDGSLLNSFKLFLNSFKLFSSCLSEGIVPRRNTVLDNWAYNCAVKN